MDLWSLVNKLQQNISGPRFRAPDTFGRSPNDTRSVGREREVESTGEAMGSNQIASEGFSRGDAYVKSQVKQRKAHRKKKKREKQAIYNLDYKVGLDDIPGQSQGGQGGYSR